MARAKFHLVDSFGGMYYEQMWKFRELVSSESIWKLINKCNN